MIFSVSDAAALLGTSNDQIYRWIKERGLPAYKIHDRYQLNRAELLEWATANGLPIAPTLFSEASRGAKAPISVTESLEKGGIHHGIRGERPDQLLRAIVDLLPLPVDTDRGFLVDVLGAREGLGSTAIGDGIAIPHVRSPIVVGPDERPILSLCFLAQPVEFGAVDGKPVHALFTLICPTIRIHLEMLSRLAFLLRDQAFRAAVVRQADARTLLDLARRVESTMKPPPTGGAA